MNGPPIWRMQRLDDIYETERRLLYVACTRARKHLLLVIPL